MKPRHSSISRIYHAIIYSAQGLAAVFKSEAAFRQELILFLLLLPVLYFLPISFVFKIVLISANTAVLIVEILNSAIEAVVDLVSPEFNAYAKRAKDMGSAAVFLSLLLTGLLWLSALLSL